MRLKVDLRSERLNRGHSVRSGAEAIGVPRATLTRAESGLGVHPAAAKLIADYYGYRVTDVWTPEPRERTAA